MVSGTKKLKFAILAIGDLAAAYLALLATLFIRYQGNEFADHWHRHLLPFTIVFVLWLVIFFIVGLYEYDELRNRLDLLSKTGEALAAAFLVSLAVFYLVPDFRITPKTNLVIALAIYAALFVGWRILTLYLFSKPRFRSSLVFLGEAPEAPDLCALMNANPQMGYSCLGIVKDASNPEAFPACDAIVVSHLQNTREELTPLLYERFFEAITVTDLPTVYEKIRRAVPESAMNERWVVDNLAKREGSIYDQMKRPLDLLMTVVLLPTLVLWPFIALAIWLDDRGPVFYRQSRVGLNGRKFTILKFRTMRVGAEAGGAAFASKDDPRVTRVGRFLRDSRLDELPQLWNIFRGDMSFVGPRPERPEMEAEISKSVPLFPVRHLVRPGLTGWAQVNAPYAAETEDHLKKLRYDLYYLKHRSLTLDVAIILRTIYSVFKRRGR